MLLSRSYDFCFYSSKVINFKSSEFDISDIDYDYFIRYVSKISMIEDVSDTFKHLARS